MCKKFYAILMVVMLSIAGSVALNSCGDSDEFDGTLNGINLTGTNWYNKDYSLTFTSTTEAVLRYRSGGSDTYYVVKGEPEKYTNCLLMLLTGGEKGYAEWWITSVSESKITLQSPPGSIRATLYRSNKE